MLIVLFIFYLGIQILFFWLSNNQEVSYMLKLDNNSFEVIEKSDFNNHNYFYDVTINNINFSFQIFKDYGKKIKLLTDIKYYEDEEYKCILPIFNGEILLDMICYNDVYDYYRNIKGKNEKLDNYVANLDIYNENQFIDQNSSSEISNLMVFKENLINNHFIALKNYRGLFIINNEFDSIVKDKNLFSKDIYNQKISTFINEYYLVADYNETHEFNKIIIFDIVNLEISEIISNTAISLDSYIQGVVDDKIYLYDKDNKIQYEIDIQNKSIVKTGTEIKYNDGEWKTMSIAEANQEKKFGIENNYGFEGYEKIDKVGNDCGYYYLYKKNGNKYDVYRVNIQNNSGLIYIFSTQSLDLINYVDDYVYFVENNKIKVYNDSFGTKNILDYAELEFNKNINFYVYAE